MLVAQGQFPMQVRAGGFFKRRRRAKLAQLFASDNLLALAEARLQLQAIVAAKQAALVLQNQAGAGEVVLPNFLDFTSQRGQNGRAQAAAQINAVVKTPIVKGGVVAVAKAAAEARAATERRL